MIQAYRGYKYRLYPDREARAYFARCFGVTRYCYNYCVRTYDKACKEGREVSGYDVMALAREHMSSLPWMSDVDYEIKESAPMRFDKALSKYKRYQANRPREHKKGERPSMSYTTGGVIKVDFKHNLVQLPKIGIIRARLHRTFDGEITSATVKREADGNYYVSLNVKNDAPAVQKKPHTEAGTIGIDVGIRHLASLSDGTTIDLPDMQRSVKRVQFLKQRLERQKEGSQRYYHTKLQISRLYHYMANVTKDTHFKTAAELCRKYDTICMETLNVEGMRKGERSNKTAADNAFNAELHRAAFALFADRIRQKADDTGTTFVSIDRFEPTTKRCHVCGYVLPTIDLDTKQWTCPECGTHHDRDINAAINIRNNGIEQLRDPQTKADKIEEQLPPAEGKVIKSAKKATAGCNLRTGKMTVRRGRHIMSQLDRQPKAQIADGTAPPRIFNKPQIEIPEELNFFKILPLITKAGVTLAQFKKWKEQISYGEIPDDMKTMHDNILTAIRQVSDELRHTKLKYDKDRSGSYEVLGRMNKVVRADWLIAEVMPVEPNFTVWRSKRRKPQEIQIINKVVTRQFPDRLDEMVFRLKAYAYEQEQNFYADNTDEFMLKNLYIGSQLKMCRLARRAGIKTFVIDRWLLFKYKYGERMFRYDEILRLMQALKELASQLRGMEITETSMRGINRQLKELEREVWMSNILIQVRFYQAGNEKKDYEAYDEWKAGVKTKEDIEKINQVVCYELPELIDRYVARELPALHWEMQSVARQ